METNDWDFGNHLWGRALCVVSDFAPSGFSVRSHRVNRSGHRCAGITRTKIFLFGQLAVLVGIFILGIVVLCVNKGLANDQPRPKARKVTIFILLLLLLFFVTEIVPNLLDNSGFSFSTVLSIAYFVPLLVFCILGLKPKNNDSAVDPITAAPTAPSAPTYPAAPVSPTGPVSAIDAEILELRKQIELNKLKKELAQIQGDKQTELEQLRKELAELE